MKISFLNQKKLPLVVEPEGGDSDGVLPALFLQCDKNRDFWRSKLLESGALLFRGFDFKAPEEFARFVRAFSGVEPLDYVGGVSPRIKLGGGVYTSTEYPNHYMLSLHNEMSYTYKTPELLYFFCVTPAETGGETPIADSRSLLQAIDSEIVNKFKEKQIRYDRHLNPGEGIGMSWQTAFETEDKSAVEDYCRKAGAKFKWKDDGGLWLSEVRPATAVHPETNEEVWFNQADGFHTSGMHPATYEYFISLKPEKEFPNNSYFGDGSPLDVAELNHIREVMEREMIPVKWQAGDILVLDNILAAHGRMPYTGGRKVLLAMT